MHPMQSSGGGSRNHIRFYIVLVTLVVGGIIFLLLLNNSNPKGFSLTSAIVGELNKTKEIIEEEPSATEQTRSKINQVFGEEIKKNGKEVPIQLSFDHIPSVDKESKIDSLLLDFDDLSTTINVNDDKLELNNMKEVHLGIKGFAGKVVFDDEGFSLKGIARRIEVNDVAFSTEKELSISFNKLQYRTFQLEGISLKDVSFPSGSGTLGVSEKLTYTLDQEEVKLYSYQGSFSGSKESNSTTSAVTLDGMMQGISISGQELGINVW